MSENSKFTSKQAIEKLDAIKKLIESEGLTSQEITERLGINRGSLKKYTFYMKNTNQIYICDYQLSGNASAPVYRAGNKKSCEKITGLSLLKKVSVKKLAFHKATKDFITSWIPRLNLKNEAYSKK